MRITKDEILSTIEMFVNSIYDMNGKSGWEEATLEEWITAVYEEIVNWKLEDGCCWKSNENRFEGKTNIVNRIKPLLEKRLQELKEEGFEIKAI